MKPSTRCIMSVCAAYGCLLAAGSAGGGQMRSDGAPPYASNRPLPSPVLFAPGVISTGEDDAHPTFTADGRTVYFVKTTASLSYFSIVKSTFEHGAWTRPVMAPFSGQHADTDVFLTHDGSKLFFVSKRPVDGAQPKPDTDIWMMTRTDGGWSQPHHIAELNSDKDEWFPTLSRDATIYFGSERPGGQGGCDIWRSRFVDGRYLPPENLGKPINTRHNEIEAFVAPDESWMILAVSGRSDSLGAYDLYSSDQRNGRWAEPRNLGRPINSSGWEFGAKLSPDGRYLFFTSSRDVWDRPPTERLTYEELERRLRAPGNGRYDIYQVDARALKPRW